MCVRKHPPLSQNDYDHRLPEHSLGRRDMVDMVKESDEVGPASGGTASEALSGYLPGALLHPQAREGSGSESEDLLYPHILVADVAL